MLAAALLVPLAFTLAPAGTAKAAPVPTARLEVRLDKLNRQADQLVEEYLQRKLALDRTRGSLKALRAQADQAERTLRALQAGMAARMAAAYVQGPGTSLASVLASEDPAEAIDRAQVLDILAERDGSMLDQLEVAARTYEARRNALVAAEKAQAAEVAGLNAKKAEVDRAVAQTRRLIAQNKAAAARPAPRQPGNPVAPPPPPSGGGGGSGAAAVAVRTALAQVGKPYSYGAAGPNAFDCSGLTMYAWNAAGVSLPHSSGAQIGVGRRISFSELQPGDLIFYYSPISHVSMYIGNGQRVSATHTGDYVRVQSLGSGMVGASRPTG